MKKLLALLILCFGITLIAGNCFAKGTLIPKSNGQTLFLPLAHMDFSYDRGDGQIIYQRIFNRIMLRNTDPNHQISITSIKIFDPDGQLLTELIDTPVSLGPLASTTYGMPHEIPFHDSTITGRHCALVTWQAAEEVIHPNIGVAMAWAVREGNGWKYTAFDSKSGKIIE